MKRDGEGGGRPVARPRLRRPGAGAYVASVLQRLGKPATLVFGGMADWTERGYPVEKTAK